MMAMKDKMELAGGALRNGQRVTIDSWANIINKNTQKMTKATLSFVKVEMQNLGFLTVDGHKNRKEMLKFHAKAVPEAQRTPTIKRTQTSNGVTNGLFKVNEPSIDIKGGTYTLTDLLKLRKQINQLEKLYGEKQ